MTPAAIAASVAAASPQVQAVVAALRDLVDDKNARIAELETLLLQRPGPMTLRLTRTQAQILGAIVARAGAIATRDYIFDVVYGGLPDADWPETKIIDVYLCRIRTALREACARDGLAPIEVETVWGTGYRIAADRAGDVRRMLGIAA